MRPPVPPFTEETARAKVQAAEDAWNTRDPEKVAAAYTPDSQWRNRDEFFTGREAIVAFLRRKWEREASTRCARTCGPSPAIASPCASSTSRAMPPAAGGAATATSSGSSTPTATCAGASSINDVAIDESERRIFGRPRPSTRPLPLA